MINWENITKVFSSDLLSRPVKALDDVTFSLVEGSTTGYIGANGAGKTTSIKIALGFTSTTKGQVTFAPSLGSDREEIFKHIGFLPERPYFYPHLTGNEFAQYMGLLSGMTQERMKERVTQLAERFGIAHALDRPLRTYSKGMLQRMGFLVAIQHDPKLIVLDEPLSGLDPLGRKELKDVIVDLSREGKTVFFSTHIVSDVEEICDRIVFLEKGKLSYNGGVADMLAKASSRVCRVMASFSQEPKFSTPIIEQKSHGSTWQIKVDTQHREKLLGEILSTGGQVVELSSEGATLEQIFYGVNK